VVFYDDRIVPHLVRLSMRQATLVPYRRRLIPTAAGRVVEIGVGTGENLRLYSTQAERVIALDPSPRLLSMAREAAQEATVPVDLMKGSAQEIPLADKCADTVVMTWTLCSIPDPSRALREIRRVLRESGRLLFVEHGRSPDPNISRWQDRLTPLWRRIAGGCHLNRPMRLLIEAAGFRFERIDTGYLKGPKAFTFTYEGSARASTPLMKPQG
jgi:ubiquinone/menaquinone biosynthesis C-methylase UbiE